MVLVLEISAALEYTRVLLDRLLAIRLHSILVELYALVRSDRRILEEDN